MYSLMECPLAHQSPARPVSAKPFGVKANCWGRENTPFRNGATAELTRRGAESFVCRAAVLEYGQLADAGVEAESYLVLGLANCFEQNEEGKLQPRMVIEPIASNSLECMVLGAKTCFKVAHGMSLEEALQRDKGSLPEDFQEASYCTDFDARCAAVARTWQRPHALDNLLDLVPLGHTRRQFNFNIESKRVLNFENEVSDSDNIKQDMSIDVYGRKQEDAPESPKANKETQTESTTKKDPKAEKKAEESEDDLDALLAD